MGPTWGPSWADRDQVGRMLAPWALLTFRWVCPFRRVSANKRRNSIANAWELCLSCTNPSICYWQMYLVHDDVIKWKHFPRYLPFVRGMPQCLLLCPPPPPPHTHPPTHPPPPHTHTKASDAELWCFLSAPWINRTHCDVIVGIACIMGMMCLNACSCVKYPWRLCVKSTNINYNKTQEKQTMCIIRDINWY